jgi:hypothetical protein
MPGVARITMDWLQDRRILLSIGGGVLALLMSLGVAIGLAARDHKPPAPPPASVGGLVVQMGAPDNAKLDPAQPLRCFVGGQFVGMETLADCAKKNGVATKALDVGVDPNGALTAANGVGADLAPLPPADAAQADTAPTATPAQPATAQGARGPAGDCLRYGGGVWHKTGEAISLSACVQALYDGHCAKTGEADYGRWGAQTLRLVPHHVEMASDNRNFHNLVDQDDASCGIGGF